MTSFDLTLTPFEAKILDLVLEEAGVDRDDPRAVGRWVTDAARRVVARHGAPRAGGEPPSLEELLDPLVLLCVANGRERPATGD